MANQTTTSHLVYPNTYLTFKDEMDENLFYPRWRVYLNDEYTDCYLEKYSDTRYSLEKRTSEKSTMGLQMWKLDSNPTTDKKFACEVYEWMRLYNN